MKIITGIASTTHIDRHFERYAKSALDGMAKQIKQKYIPYLVEHDSNRQIGVILYGEVFKLTDGEHALGVVVAEFQSPEERGHFVNGTKNTAWTDYKKYLDISDLIKMQANRIKEPDELKQRKRSDLSLNELLEMHLDSTQISPEGQIYKIKKFVASTGDLRIEVYPKDHENQPHFHVISKQRRINARFDLNTLDLISEKVGKISPKDIKKIRSFFESEHMLQKLKQEHAKLN